VETHLSVATLNVSRWDPNKRVPSNKAPNPNPVKWPQLPKVSFFLLDYRGYEAQWFKRQASCISKETIYFSFDQRERNHYYMISGFSWVKNSSSREGSEDELY